MDNGTSTQKPARSAGHTALTVVGVVLCVILIPILAVNCTLIVRSYLEPDSVPGVGGATPLIVMSDSMYPEIQKGDLIICESVDPETLGAGDVITFYDPEASTDITIVTHRITEVTEVDGQLAFMTQGDANDSADPHATLATDVIGEVSTRLPGVGNAAMFMQSTPGLVVCVALPILLLVLYDVVRTRLYQRRARGDTAELMAELEALRAERSGTGAGEPGGAVGDGAGAGAAEGAAGVVVATEASAEGGGAAEGAAVDVAAAGGAPVADAVEPVPPVQVAEPVEAAGSERGDGKDAEREAEL